MLVLAWAVQAWAGGAIEGRVELPKTRAAQVMSKRYDVVTTGGAVAMSPPLAVVYVEGAFPPPATNPVARIIQKDYRFVPALLPIRKGTRVEFVNDDDAYHSIFSYSKPRRFDLGRYRSDERPIPSEVFPEPGLVTLRCDIHEHMRGLVLVLDTPHFTTTDEAGSFRLDGLPAGRHVVKVWLSSTNTLERTVEVAEGETAVLNVP